MRSNRGPTPRIRAQVFCFSYRWCLASSLVPVPIASASSEPVLIAGVSSEPVPLACDQVPAPGPSSSDDTTITPISTTTTSTTTPATDTPIDTTIDTTTDTTTTPATNTTTTTITTIDPWASMTHSKWSKLGGAHTKRELKWKKEQDDLVEVFGMSLENLD